MDADVVIIGAGLAGIAAAVAERAAGRSVIVLEASERAGGEVGTAPTRRGDIELGPFSFQGKHPAFWRLLGALGLLGAVRPLGSPGAVRYVVRDGKLQPLSPSVAGFLGTPALGLRGKLRVLAEPWSRETGGPDVHSVMVARFGAEMADRLGAAMINGIFAADPATLDAATCFPDLVRSGSVLRRGLSGPRPIAGRSGLFTLDGGLGRIGDTAAGAIGIRLRSPVKEIRLEAGVEVDLDHETVRAERVIVATEAPEAARLFPREPALAEALGRFAYAPLTVVHWWSGAAHPSGFGWLSPEREGLFGLGDLYTGAMAGTPGRHATFVGGAVHPERASLSESALRDGIEQDHRRLGQAGPDEILQVVRWKRALYQPTLGHRDRLDAVRRASSSRPVRFAGSWLGAAAMKDAIASGFRAAAA